MDLLIENSYKLDKDGLNAHKQATLLIDISSIGAFFTDLLL